MYLLPRSEKEPLIPQSPLWRQNDIHLPDMFYRCSKGVSETSDWRITSSAQQPHIHVQYTCTVVGGERQYSLCMVHLWCFGEHYIDIDISCTRTRRVHEDACIEGGLGGGGRAAECRLRFRGTSLPDTNIWSRQRERSTAPAGEARW